MKVINVKSDQVKVFPSVGRDDTIDTTAHLMTEDNIAGIIRGIVPIHPDYPHRNGSFIVNSYINEDKTLASFEFFLGGYHFKLDNLNLTEIFEGNDLRTLHVGIRIANSSDPTVTTYQHLIPADSTIQSLSLDTKDKKDKKFIGLALIVPTVSEESLDFGKYKYHLRLLKDGKVPGGARLIWYDDFLAPGIVTGVNYEKENNRRCLSLTINKPEEKE